MKQKNTLAFTLIEVLVAASILSVTVFGVYKLIGENTRLISNNEQYSFVNTLFPTLQQCIEYIHKTDPFGASTTYSFNFGVNGQNCEHSTGHPVILDGVEYSLFGTTGADISTQIDWTLEISADTIKPITKQYTQIP